MVADNDQSGRVVLAAPLIASQMARQLTDRGPSPMANDKTIDDGQEIVAADCRLMHSTQLPAHFAFLAVISVHAAVWPIHSSLLALCTVKPVSKDRPGSIREWSLHRGSLYSEP